MRPWTDEEIIDYFDSSNITIAELSEMTGRSITELKQLLMGEG